MGSVDRMDGRSFKANFSGEGVGKLREKVEEKLKEFMGDYTDNTLVEYVIVLLRNGRHKEEARNELNVFLGDDSDSFVSWLWDHLASNLDLYVESQGSHVDDVPKIKPAVVEQARRNDILHLKSEIEVKPDKLSRSRHNRDWKRLGKDEDQPPPLLSSVIYSNHPEEKNDHEVSRGRRSQSPRPRVQRKRSRHDEHQNTKRDAVSQVHATASRRLLQFAVRDAVATAKPSNAAITEPTSKRLRSIVSTSTTTGGSSAIAPARHLQSVARVANPMASVIKAVAEAAEDATRVRSSSVFDRLGRGASGSSGQAAEFDAPTVEDGDYEDIIEMEDKPHLTYDDRRRFIQNTRMLRSEIGLTSDSVSDNEEYDDLNIAGGRLMDVSQTLTSREIRDENSMMVQYNVAKNSNDVMRISRNTEEDQLPVPGNTSHKIVNISVNLNTWKPNKYLEPREVAKLDGKKGLLENAVGAGESRSGMQLMKENDNPVIVGNGNGNSASMPQKESQKAPFPGTGLFAAARPLEDTDSRTIFVSNVHFAATKDSLSRHFNKFGEVLKVIIVTDAANGQPKGVAYVEFMRKEAADNALSLDGTSFMSRILKVVKRSSAHQEVSPVMASWPRFARGSPFVASRFGRVPFPRGIASTFRPPRLPSKPGARSFQWKRDAQATPSDSSVSSVLGINTALPSTPRSLTYVRTEPKSDGNLGSA